jgi:hypothetical protein
MFITVDDLSYDLVHRLALVRDRLGSTAYRVAIAAARQAVARSVLSCAEQSSRGSSAAVIPFPTAGSETRRLRSRTKLRPTRLATD